MKLFKKKIAFVLSLFAFSFLSAQDIPENISYTRIYDFVDELANDGIFDINSAVKPYSRSYICSKLLEAESKSDQLNNRQKKELQFFLEEFALERNALPDYDLSILSNGGSQIDVIPPVYHYRDSTFRARIQPILGMNIYLNSAGQINQKWYGADFQGMIGKQFSFYGSLRDISFTANNNLSPRLSEPTYLTNFQGYEYKEPNDFSDSRGGVSVSWNWGSVGLMKENIVWGDNYNGSNILSGRVPSFPMIALRIKPAKWFELNYIHGWLVSNVVDSSKYYIENNVKKWYRNHNKFIAANFFTFTPVPKLDISFGNSIIYAEDNIQPAYLIPIAFYKSIDHTLTKGIGTENQNSQIFFNISTRNLKHVHLYSSIYFDEINFSRFKPSSKEKNPYSVKIGGKINNFPIQNLNATVEYTRTNIINYKHSIDVLTYASNSYNLGHYLGDNAEEIYASIGYKPVRGLDFTLSYVDAKHGNEYNFARVGADANLRQIISQPSLGDVIWTNKTLGFKILYEVFNDAYAIVNIENSNIQGYDAKSQPILGEKRMTAQEVLNYYTPTFLQGKKTTLTIGFSFGF